MLTINSGKLVPRATTVIPIIISEMSNLYAIFLLLSITTSAPTKSITKPIKNKKNGNNSTNINIDFHY